jgi:transcription antitermination factor NusG
VCEALRVPCYLPLRVHRTVSGGKVNTFHLPMFPGYVFAAVSAADWLPLKRTNSVADRIEARDEAGLLRDLQNVLTVERAQVDLVTAATLKPGQKVIVASGPLAGVTGTVLRYKNRTRLQVVIEAIGQAVVLDVDRDSVVPVV